MLHLNTILHPTDFSAPSEHAWRLACCLARDHGARLILVHVKTTGQLLYAETALPQVDSCPEVQLREMLQEITPNDSRLPVERFLIEGEPAQGLLEFMQETPVDLVVMGSHGRTGLDRLVMGSVAEQVVRKAPCPVMIVKQPVPETIAEPTEAIEPAYV